MLLSGDGSVLLTVAALDRHHKRLWYKTNCGRLSDVFLFRCSVSEVVQSIDATICSFCLKKGLKLISTGAQLSEEKGGGHSSQVEDV